MNGAMEWCENIMTEKQLTSMHGGTNVGFYHNFDVVDCPQS
jgi:hypothetical protein